MSKYNSIEQILTTHTEFNAAIIMKAATSTGRTKTLALLYDPTANWYDGAGDFEHFMHKMNCMCVADTNVVAYQGAYYRRDDNGLFYQFLIQEPALLK